MHPIYFNEQVRRKPLGNGHLDGQTFAVKDVFALAGEKNSAGNPVWYETHDVATTTAPVIEQLLQQGATLKGLTHTDELMYSLNGENVHYGTPVNPLYPQSIPGGSSSGSAVAVASGAVDFALGTDTGGSVRIPSSYCGLYGIRPTHGAVDIDGVIPLAAQFDTVGWMARNAQLLATVGDVLLSQSVQDIKTVYIPEEAWALAEGDVTSLRGYIEETFQDAHIRSISLADLVTWSQAFRLLQGEQIWQTHGEWVKAVNPVFGEDIADRFKWASTIQRDADWEQAAALKVKVSAELRQLLGTNAVIAIPTTAGVAPEKGRSLALVEQTRTRTMQLTCIAGLSGLPQVTMPIGASSLSFIGGEHQDQTLLHWLAQHAKQPRKSSIES